MMDQRWVNASFLLGSQREEAVWTLSERQALPVDIFVFTRFISTAFRHGLQSCFVRISSALYPSIPHSYPSLLSHLQVFRAKHNQ